MSFRRKQTSMNSVIDKNSQRWSTEKDVPGDIYNHPQLEEGYNDDNIYTQPYRHITNWFLAKPGHQDSMRKPFPKDPTKFSQTSLYGELEPYEDDEGILNLNVAVSDIKYWMFDRHREDRGIWILSKNAWYRLKQPCKKVIKRLNGIDISQNELHHSFHAKLGLLSNIIDMMSDSRGYIQPSLVAYHSKLSPEASHKALCPNHDEILQNPLLCKEPFDLRLLKRDPAFVRQNLENLDTTLSNTCVFMLGLKKLEREAERRGNDKDFTKKEFDFIKSAEAAEKRSQRWPWGEQKEDEDETWSNKMVELSNLKLKLTMESSPSLKASRTNDEVGNHSDSSEYSFHSIGSFEKDCKQKKLKSKRKDSNSVDIPQTNGMMSSLDTSNSPKSPSNQNSIRDNLTLETENRIKLAEKNLQMYVDPKTGSVRETTIMAFIKNIIYTDPVLPPERMLVSIDRLQKSSIDVKKKLFDTNNPRESGVRGIFILWLDTLLQIMNDNQVNNEKNKNITEKGVENIVVASILKLLASFNFIKKKSQLGKIKELFDVDLFSCVEKVQTISSQCQDEKLIKMCKETKTFLTNINENPLKKDRHISSLNSKKASNSPMRKSKAALPKSTRSPKQKNSPPKSATIDQASSIKNDSERIDQSGVVQGNRRNLSKADSEMKNEKKRTGERDQKITPKFSDQIDVINKQVKKRKRALPRKNTSLKSLASQKTEKASSNTNVSRKSANSSVKKTPEPAQIDLKDMNTSGLPHDLQQLAKDTHSLILNTQNYVNDIKAASFRLNAESTADKPFQQTTNLASAMPSSNRFSDMGYDQSSFSLPMSRVSYYPNSQNQHDLHLPQNSLHNNQIINMQPRQSPNIMSPPQKTDEFAHFQNSYDFGAAKWKPNSINNEIPITAAHENNSINVDIENKHEHFKHADDVQKEAEISNTNFYMDQHTNHSALKVDLNSPIGQSNDGQFYDVAMEKEDFSDYYDSYDEDEYVNVNG